MSSGVSCRCCEQGQSATLPRVCPECSHIFQGNGWEGIDAHWRSKHESVMRYEDFWSGICQSHGGGR